MNGKSSSAGFSERAGKRRPVYSARLYFVVGDSHFQSSVVAHSPSALLSKIRSQLRLRNKFKDRAAVMFTSRGKELAK